MDLSPRLLLLDFFSCNCRAYLLLNIKITILHRFEEEIAVHCVVELRLQIPFHIRIKLVQFSLESVPIDIRKESICF